MFLFWKRKAKNFLKKQYFLPGEHDILICMDSRWLKKQFDLNPKKTKAGLARAMGLEPPAVSKILKGTRQIKAQEYAIMRRYFDLPVDGEAAVSTKPVLKPLAQEAVLQEEDAPPDNDDWVIPEKILRQHTKAPPDQIKIFTVDEALMEPGFKRGERVLVDLSDQMPSPPGVYIVSDGYSYLTRQCEIVPGSDPVEITLSARDQSFKSQRLKLDELKIIGRVIAKLHWL